MTTAHTDHPLRHWDRTCPACIVNDDRERFESFVRENLGDIPVMDGGRYISPKIQKYWLTWQAASEPHPPG